MMIWSVTVPDDVELDPTQVSRHQQHTWLLELPTTIRKNSDILYF